MHFCIYLPLSGFHVNAVWFIVCRHCEQVCVCGLHMHVRCARKHAGSVLKIHIVLHPSFSAVGRQPADRATGPHLAFKLRRLLWAWPLGQAGRLTGLGLHPLCTHTHRQDCGVQLGGQDAILLLTCQLDCRHAWGANWHECHNRADRRSAAGTNLPNKPRCPVSQCGGHLTLTPWTRRWALPLPWRFPGRRWPPQALSLSWDDMVTRRHSQHTTISLLVITFHQPTRK